MLLKSLLCNCSIKQRGNSNIVAHRENLNLQAKVGRFSDGIKKYHVKGLLVDNKAVMLGSMN